MPEIKRRKDGSQYCKYSDEEIENAKSISMIDFLGREYGYTFQRVGSYYKGKEHDSLMIKNDERSWFWNSQNLHGRNAFDWLIQVEHVSFTEALERLIGSPANDLSENRKSLTYTAAPNVSSPSSNEIKEIKIPERDEGKPSRAFAYLLKTRCLDADIVSQLFKEKLIYQDTKGNVIFVGYDENKEIRFCERKMTNTYLANLKDENGKRVFPPVNISGSDKRYSFNVKADKSCFPNSDSILYVFEAPVDLLSHATFRMLNERARAASAGEKPNLNAWRNVNRLSLSSVHDTALESYLERNPHIKKIVFALDYDSAGIKMAEKYEQKYTDLGYSCSKIKPLHGKDFNEWLQLYTEQSKQRGNSAAQNKEVYKPQIPGRK